MFESLSEEQKRQLEEFFAKYEQQQKPEPREWTVEDILRNEG